MKKVLQTLFLISFLAVLVVPTIVSAATCPTCSQPTAPCECGGGNYPSGALIWCYNGTAYVTPQGCINAQQIGGTTGTTGGTIENIPLPFSSVEGLIGKIDAIGNYIFTGLLALAAVFMVVAGYYFVIARGD
ncbi:MAG: hypothetical protein ABH841_01260, partial [Candidatus Nealsonbacteria bacterium]